MRLTFMLVMLLCALVAGTARARIFLLDFGPLPTPEDADSNGNYWNNVNKPVLNYLVDSGKEFSSIGLNFETHYAAGKNGGLQRPDAQLLGDFSVATATSDYFYNATSSNCTFRIINLDPLSSYRLRFFASRSAKDSRITIYTVEAGNGTFAAELQTSGQGVSADTKSDGNDQHVAQIDNLKPDADGRLRVSYGTKTGGFSYIGAMEIRVESATGLLQ